MRPRNETGAVFYVCKDKHSLLYSETVAAKVVLIGGCTSRLESTPLSRSFSRFASENIVRCIIMHIIRTPYYAPLLLSSGIFQGVAFIFQNVAVHTSRFPVLPCSLSSGDSQHRIVESLTALMSAIFFFLLLVLSP